MLSASIVDVVIVDEVNRKPIGRPYLTVAIDVFSRCIAGFCLTFESPSAISVGLCLTHAIFDKDSWLEQRGLKSSWPIWGKPNAISVDNAQEFHSEALHRGCEFYGIKIIYRPPGRPHYGGIIERLLGTLMSLVHQLPETTFSNTQERNQYPSEHKAVLTLIELERWLAIAITDYYHQKFHRSLQMSPLEKYTQGILGSNQNVGRGYPPRIQHKQRFLIDFLPLVRRTLRRDGIVLFHIAYYSNAFKPWLGDIHYKRLLIRYDPRDLSRIYVFDPVSKSYFDIPYRTLSRPKISLWEQREAIKSLRIAGKKQVDETVLLQAIDKMRQIVKQAKKQSRAIKRHQAQAAYCTQFPLDKQVTHKLKISGNSYNNNQEAPPFEDIETW